jgi:hypothetical protein
MERGPYIAEETQKSSLNCEMSMILQYIIKPLLLKIVGKRQAISKI